jgi:acyl-CoA synthetase (NDP forming)
MLDLSAILDAGFSATVLAVYGATNRPGAMGSQIIERLIGAGYRGEFIFVSNRDQEIAGRQSVTSATLSPLKADHALVVVPAESVPSALRDAGAAGIKVATIFSSGFAEIGGEGLDLDRELRAAIAATGIRILGPNCLGFISFRDRVLASTLNLGSVEFGPVSVVGQSGSVSARLATGISDSGTGLDLCVTIGNSIDVGPAEIVDYLADRATTKVIVLYLESLGTPLAMRAAIEKARAAGKEVVVLKSGRTEAGARSAASHTGATASKDVFVDILLRDAGALRVKTVQEACDVSALLARVGRLKGRAAVVAPSGGDCTLAADRCAELGITLSEISEEAQVAMRAAVPICAPGNPIDPTTMAFRDKKLGVLLDLTADEPDVDFIIFLTSTTLLKPEGIVVTVPALLGARAKGIPVIVGAHVAPEVRITLREAGIGLVEDSERVFDIVRMVLDPSAEPDHADAHGTPAIPVLMDERIAMRTLGQAGLPMIETVEIVDAKALDSAVQRLGYPLVLKGIVPQVGHKSGLGLVKLNLGDYGALTAAFEDVRAKTASMAGAVIVVQPAISNALAELLIGVVTDPVYGKHVTLGMGGLFTDFFKDRVWAHAPVTHDQATRMLEQLPVGRGLLGKRMGVSGDAGGVIAAIVRLSEWAVENDAAVEEVEINPLMVRRNDVVAVDALIATRDAGAPKVEAAA